MANCVHGFPSDQCLICQTLGHNAGEGDGKGPSRSRRRGTKTATVPSTDVALALSGPTGRLPQTTGDRGSAAERTGGAHRLFFAVVAVLVIGGLFLWAFTGIVSLAFHIAEYVALAVAAGWVGYKAGYARGRRHPR